MDEPQIIKAPNGDELVVIPRRDYETLMSKSLDAIGDEDNAHLRPEILERMKALEEGREVVIPSEIAVPIMNGKLPIPVLRKWRRLTQVQLSQAAGIGQAQLSQIERGEPASLTAMDRIAKALGVPTDLLTR